MFMLPIRLNGITKNSADLSYRLTLGLGSKGHNTTFSEHGHVEYQLKGNHKMQQHGS